MTTSQMSTKGVSLLRVPGRWCVHAYYTLCPWAPDGSGRLLLAGADLSRDRAEVLVLDAAGEVVQRCGDTAPHGGFWHTGWWQTWDPDSRGLRYQSGTLAEPQICVHDLDTGAGRSMAGDMEGAPPAGGPVISGAMGMLYAAGYGDGSMHPELSPVPFAARDQHGLYRIDTASGARSVVLSTEACLQAHPDRDRLLAFDREQHARTGDGLTLMCYCVRWSPTGNRLLFYFGNHCVDKARGEPRLAYIMTADPELRDVRMALDLSCERRGVHWSWCPDDERLIGYGPQPSRSGMCLATVRHDGSDYRHISDHASGGHPSMSPTDDTLIATDESRCPNGRVLLLDARTGAERHEWVLPRVHGDTEPKGRNPYRVCHHPVFNPAGDRLLVNTIPEANGGEAQCALLRW
ncbi:MAG: hypothetical protein PF961_05705 [Planctomycetota bacterium]|jgi:hypothetical protein|nr:hypothetical protein [Planctomycetota bacterium]